MPGLTTRRSTTISMVCFFFLSMGTGSASSLSSPSTRARTKPEAAAAISSFRYSPLRPRTMGARTWMRVSAGSAMTASMICCDGLGRDLPAAVVAVGFADAREEQAEVVVDLGHRADGGAGVLARGLLLDGDGRGEALDGVHVRLVHLVQELAGVGRQALDVAALALGVEGVEGQRRLARARQARDDHQLVPRDLEVDVLEIVLAAAFDDDLVHRKSRTIIILPPARKSKVFCRSSWCPVLPSGHRRIRQKGPIADGPPASEEGVAKRSTQMVYYKQNCTQKYCSAGQRGAALLRPVR